MSERNNIIEVESKKKGHEEKEQDLESEEDDKRYEKYGFGISAKELENIVGHYKERGDNFQDLEYFKKNKGVQRLIDNLSTNDKIGISSTEGREDIYGSNKVFVEPVPPFCSYVWEALEDTMVRVLIVCAVVQIILGCTLSDDPSKDWVDGVSIIVAILVVVLVGSITNYQKAQKFHELNDEQNKGTKYTVIRSGKPKEFVSDDILVGDLIVVNYGDIMAADLLLVEGNGIKMDESALTGESDAMKKEPFDKCIDLEKKGERKLPSPLILSGTNEKGELNNNLFIISIGRRPCKIFQPEIDGIPPEPRMNCKMQFILSYDFIIIHGGTGNNLRILNDIMILNTESFNWIKPIFENGENAPKELIHRTGHEMFFNQGKIYILGGRDQENYLKMGFECIQFEITNF